MYGWDVPFSQLRKSGSSRNAGEIGGALEGSPRHFKIAWIASGEFMAAKILMRPEQRSHFRTSTSNTRFNNSDYVQLRGWELRGCREPLGLLSCSPTRQLSWSADWAASGTNGEHWRFSCKTPDARTHTSARTRCESVSSATTPCSAVSRVHPRPGVTLSSPRGWQRYSITSVRFT